MPLNERERVELVQTERKGSDSHNTFRARVRHVVAGAVGPGESQKPVV